jgi:hypothetical protein
MSCTIQKVCQWYSLFGQWDWGGFQISIWSLLARKIRPCNARQNMIVIGRIMQTVDLIQSFNTERTPEMWSIVIVLFQQQILIIMLMRPSTFEFLCFIAPLGSRWLRTSMKDIGVVPGRDDEIFGYKLVNRLLPFISPSPEVHDLLPFVINWSSCVDKAAYWSNAQKLVRQTVTEPLPLEISNK